MNSLICTPEELQQFHRPRIKNPIGRIGIVDLFCGCGGLSLGVLQACALTSRDFRIRLAVDNNEKAIEVYAHNFSSFADAIINQDIAALVDVGRKTCKASPKESQALREAEGTDLLVAGPPCQGHSDLNNSSRRDDPRNLLYMAPVRAAVVLRPKVVMIENVPTVIKSSEGVVSSALKLLKDAGYHTVEFAMNLTQVGVPQSRVRHVLLASKSPLDSVLGALQSLPVRSIPCIEYIQDISDEASSSAKDAYNRVSRLSQQNDARIAHLFRTDTYDLPNELRPSCHRDREHSYVSMYGRLHPMKPAQTITSGFGSMGQGRFVHPTQQRMITAHEAARLQGFPDYFAFPGERVTALREMIGNAVPPTLSKVVVKLLIEHGHFT